MKGREDSTGEIVIGDLGISIIWAKGGKYHLEWHHVEEVVAFKRDLFAYDLICVSFRVPDPATQEDFWYEVDEEMKGWKGLIEEMERRLEGVMKQEAWFKKVAVPAFETNALTLYRRG